MTTTDLTAMDPAPRVVAVAADGAHRFSKRPAAAIRLVAGLGVEGDAHAGAQVKHRSRVARDSTQPNLRRVQMVQGELHDELRAAGFAIGPTEMGEDLTTRGIDVPPPHGSLGPV